VDGDGAIAVDIDELPAQMRGRASNPILLAFQFLSPDYALLLSVKKVWWLCYTAWRRDVQLGQAADCGSEATVV